MTAPGIADWTRGTAGFAYQQCPDCKARWYFARSACPRCGCARAEAVQAAGTGTVYSATEVTRAPDDRWRAHVPYTIVLVDLDEGLRVMAHAAAGTSIGQRVRATFRDMDGHLLPFFQPERP